MVRLFIVTGLLTLGVAVSAQGPVMPFVDRRACPGEGCIYRDWKARTQIPAYQSWDTRAPVPQVFIIKAGETVTAMTGVVLTTTPGRATILRDIKVESRSRKFPNAPPVTVALARGDTVYLLTSHGEGDFTAWVKGQLLDDFSVGDLEQPVMRGGRYSSCVSSGTCDGKVVSYPVRTWWVQVRNAAGKIGWTNRAADFDGTDLYGN